MLTRRPSAALTARVLRGGRRRKGASLLLLGAGILGSASLARAAEPGRDEPKPAWKNGPVRYVLTPEEDKAYKGLKTDEERTQAISEFWAKRDPTPGTPANEYRDDYYKRVDQANSEFNEGTGPGWTTDRGRTLLTAGYPADRVEKTIENKEIWSYSQLAAVPELSEVKSVVGKIVFEKGESGEYKIATEGDQLLRAIRKLDPLVAAKLIFPQGVLAAKTAKAPAAPSAAGAAAKPAGSAAATAAGAPAPAAASLPPGVERLRQAALGAEPKTEIGLTTIVRYFKAEDGSARTVVVIAVKKSDLSMGPDVKPNAVLYARLLPVGPADAVPVEFIEQDLFTLLENSSEGWFEYAFGWPLKKSRSYELRVAASDGPEGKLAAHTETLALPDYKNDALTLSSLTLARTATPVGPGAPAEDKDAFRLGALRLMPCVQPVFGPKDDLGFFYDVYGAKRDPSNNLPSLDVMYVFEKKEPDGWKKKGKLPQPDQREERLGYTVSSEAIAQWAAGDYRLTVQVKDKIASVETSASVGFTVKK